MYSENPTVDDILKRIKNAFAEHNFDAPAREGGLEIAPSKPVTAPLPLANNDVYVLTPEMKLGDLPSLANVTPELFFREIAGGIANLLNTPASAFLIEDYLKRNFEGIVARSRKM